MLRVVRILVLQMQASIDTFLYLWLNLTACAWSRVSLPMYLVPHELRIQLEFHLEQLLTVGFWG